MSPNEASMVAVNNRKPHVKILAKKSFVKNSNVKKSPNKMVDFNKLTVVLVDVGKFLV